MKETKKVVEFSLLGFLLSIFIGFPIAACILFDSWWHLVWAIPIGYIFSFAVCWGAEYLIERFSICPDPFDSSAILLFYFPIWFTFLFFDIFFGEE